MRIEIDFDNKAIILKERTSLDELVKKLKEINIDWKGFSIDATRVEYYNYPYVYIPYTPTYPNPTWITVSTSSTSTWAALLMTATVSYTS